LIADINECEDGNKVGCDVNADRLQGRIT